MIKFCKGDLVGYISEVSEGKNPKEKYTFGVVLEKPSYLGSEVTSHIIDNKGIIYEIYLDHPSYGAVDIISSYRNRMC